MGRIVGIGAILAAVVWIAWPFLTMLSFSAAVDKGDAVRIEAMVDWLSLRDNLKGEMKRHLSAKLDAGDESASGSAATARRALQLLSGVLVDGLVDYYATPDGLIALLQEVAASGRAPKPGRKTDDKVRFRKAISFAYMSAPTRFRVSVRPGGADRKARPLVLVFEFRDLRWVLVRLELPLETMFEK
jgi:hypothetical protein